MDTYKGWEISNPCPPIPHRGHDWMATSPDYDVDCDEDGFFGTGETLNAETREELIKEIDNWIEENGEQS